MTTITFDTLACVKTLREAGCEERQAMALANGLKSGTADLATPRDIESLRSEVKRAYPPRLQTRRPGPAL